MNQPLLAQEYPDLWKALESLGSVLDCSGRFLYGDISTLKEGNYYLLGYNPGGDPDVERATIKDDIFAWGNKSPEESEKWNGSLKSNVKKLRGAIAPRQFCWSNLYFERSRNANLMREKNENIYWPVHEAVLDIVKPNCVFAFGVGKSSTPTYHKLKSLLGFEQNKDTYFHSGANPERDGWEPKFTEGKYKGRPLKLVGLPHLSRYSLTQEDLKRIREECLLMDGKK